MEKYELGNAALEQVAGGGYYASEHYTSESDVKYVVNVGDVVQVRNWFMIGTVTCRVTAVKAAKNGYNTGAPGMPGSANSGGWVDMYYCEETESCWYFPSGWYTRDMLEERKF